MANATKIVSYPGFVRITHGLSKADAVISVDHITQAIPTNAGVVIYLGGRPLEFDLTMDELCSALAGAVRMATGS